MSYEIYRENDNVYLNVVMNGTTPTNPIGGPSGTTLINEDNLPGVYDVTKTTPILDKCSDYYASIIRFEIPLNTVPITICPIVPNQSNPNQTPLVFGISYNGTDNSAFVIWTPNNDSPAPLQNQPFQVITDYYFIYFYDLFINMANTTLSLLWTNSGLAALFPTLLPPYFLFDPETRLLNLIVPACFVTLTAPAATIPILWMNESSIRFYDAFPTFFNGLNQPNGRDFDFYLSQFINKQKYVFNGTSANPNDPSIPSPVVYYRFEQDYETIFIWSSLRRIIVSTNTIPITNEYVPAQNNSGLNNSFPIISDYIPNINLPGESRGIAYYYPQSQYRLCDMISNIPLQKIDLKIFWEDTNSNLYPLDISTGQQASIKLAFIRKSLYKSQNSKLLKM
jgi:minor capsid protein V18/V19